MLARIKIAAYESIILRVVFQAIECRSKDDFQNEFPYNCMLSPNISPATSMQPPRTIFRACRAFNGFSEFNAHCTYFIIAGHGGWLQREMPVIDMRRPT